MKANWKKQNKTSVNTCMRLFIWHLELYTLTCFERSVGERFICLY